MKSSTAIYHFYIPTVSRGKTSHTRFLPALVIERVASPKKNESFPQSETPSLHEAPPRPPQALPSAALICQSGPAILIKPRTALTLARTSSIFYRTSSFLPRPRTPTSTASTVPYFRPLFLSAARLQTATAPPTLSVICLRFDHPIPTSDIPSTSLIPQTIHHVHSATPCPRLVHVPLQQPSYDMRGREREAQYLIPVILRGRAGYIVCRDANV